MAHPPSEHDADRGSVDDFAPERAVVQPRHTDLESVVLWLADRWRDSKRLRSSFAGTFVLLLIVGGAGLVWWSIQSPDPSDTPPEPLASFRVKDQPIEPPAIVPSVASPVSNRAVLAARGVPLIEKSQSENAVSSAGKVAERQSPAAPSGPDASQASPPMPRPAIELVPNPLPPTPASEDEPLPVRAAVPEPVPAPPAASRSLNGGTTWGSSRPGAEDPETPAIQEVLGRYRTAYAALDVGGVHQVWPAVNQRSLERAFRQLAGQDVSFFSCTVDVIGPRADVACVGTTNFIPKVGNRSPQSGPSQWNFKLSKRSAAGWLIDDAQAR